MVRQRRVEDGDDDASPQALVLTTPSAVVRSPLPSPVKRKRRRCRKEIERSLAKAREDSQLFNLTLDVNQLRQEVHHLQLHKDLVQARLVTAATDPSGSIVQLIRQYFQVFRHGSDVHHADEQLEFIYSVCDQEFVLGHTQHGRDMLLEQWKRYTAGVNRLCFEVSTIDIVVQDKDSTVVTCYGGFSGRITRAMIETAFPHALSDEDIVAKVVGRHVYFPTSKRFYLNRHGTIVRYDVVVDMVAALQAVCQTPTELTRLLCGAMIGDESMIGMGDSPATPPPSSSDSETELEQTATPPASPAQSKCGQRMSIRYLLS